MVDLRDAYKDKMAPNIRRTCLVACVGVVEILDVVCLQDQNNYPVDGDHNTIERKRTWVSIVLTPDRMAPVMAVLATVICWFSECVINT